MNPRVTNDCGSHPFLDLTLAHMHTSELHRASGESIGNHFPTFLQVRKRAQKGTTAAFPAFPAKRIQAGAAGTLHSGFGLAFQETLRLVHVCFHTALCTFLALEGTAWINPLHPQRQQRQQFSTLVLTHIP